ncbi:MAG: hypothetical protein NWF04_01875 [Candidatus Bathyarchaeota archaeon]|nr:hypothetical protein [Candidatus Bathyarchaeota archaeon]
MLTKHLRLPDEITTKIPINIEEATNMCVADLTENPSRAFCAKTPTPKKTATKPTTYKATKTALPKNKLPEIKELYNLEAPTPPQKCPNLNLDVELYQMESY